ncbi:MAG: phospholipase, partial [Polyangiaceae bacterium]
MKTRKLGGLDVILAGGTDREGGGDGPVIVLMHGFGAPAEDLVSLWRVIDAPPGTRFVFPAAPIALGGPYGDGRAWWPIDIARFQSAMMKGDLDALVREKPEGLQASRSLVESMLGALETELGAPISKVVLGGFSQGSMLALDVALHAAASPAGLLLLSSTLISADEWRPLMVGRKGLGVLQSHGQQDPILPFEVAEELRDELSAAGL